MNLLTGYRSRPEQKGQDTETGATVNSKRSRAAPSPRRQAQQPSHNTAAVKLPMEQDPLQRIAALEAELTQVRAEGVAEREQLERQLRLAKSALPEHRDPRTVTQNIAAQQDLESLRSALRERDRIVKQLTEQVRGLEDQLEDHYRHTDDLRRQLEERGGELEEVRKQAALAARRAAKARPPPQVQQAQPAARSSRQPVAAPKQTAQNRGGRALMFAFGMLVGAALAAASAVGLWWTGNLPSAPAELAARAAEPLPAQSTRPAPRLFGAGVPPGLADRLRAA
jgi:septal ring factor EnvC (AmiA/AmiB activator)